MLSQLLLSLSPRQWPLLKPCSTHALCATGCWCPSLDHNQPISSDSSSSHAGPVMCRHLLLLCSAECCLFPLQLFACIPLVFASLQSVLCKRLKEWAIITDRVYYLSSEPLILEWWESPSQCMSTKHVTDMHHSPTCIRSLTHSSCFFSHSSAIPKAVDFGISADNVFGFWDWVGGRFSVCSAVGVVPLALQVTSHSQFRIFWCFELASLLPVPPTWHHSELCSTVRLPTRGTVPRRRSLDGHTLLRGTLETEPPGPDGSFRGLELLLHGTLC